MRSFAVFVSLLLIAVAAWVWFTPARFRPLHGVPDPDAPSAERRATVESPGSVGEQPEFLRRSVDPAAGLLEPTVPVSGPDPESRLLGIVVDATAPDLEPLAGALVELLRPVAGDHRNVDTTTSRSPLQLGSVATDADGRFAFDVVPGEVHLLRVELAGYGPLVHERCFGGQDLRLALQPAAGLRGVVTIDGRAAAGVSVRIRNSALGERELGETDARGAWSQGGLAAGEALLEFVAEHAETASARLQLVAGEVLVHDVDLVRGETTVGRVLDAATGQPILGATLATDWTFSKTTTTDADGSYRMHGFPEPERTVLTVRAEGYAQRSLDLRGVPAADDGLVHADFVLVQGGVASGRVVDPRGEPIEGAYVAAMGNRFSGPGLGGSSLSSAVTDAHGRFRLGGLDLDRGYELQVRRRGFGTRVRAFPGLLGDRLELTLPDTVLHPAARIRGFVHDEHGRPLDDVWISVKGGNPDRNEFATDATRGAGENEADLRQTRTDAAGRFHCSDLSEGSFKVFARFEGSVSREVEITIPEPGALRDVDLELFLGEELAGTMRTADGEPVAVALGRAVALEPDGSGSDAKPVNATARDGSFRFRGLRPGRYRIEWTPYRPRGPEFSIEAEAGTTDLEVRLPALVTLTGRVVDAHGEGVPDCMVGAVYDGASGLTVDSDREGVFSLEVPRGQPVGLQVFVMPSPEARLPVRAELRDPDVAQGVVGPRDGIVLTLKD